MPIPPLLSVRGLSKKFSRDIKYNMYYGILDLTRRQNRITAQPPVLRKREFWAVSEVGFSLQAEVFGVVGTNGSGKTTLMRLISGIFPVDTGQILTPPDLRITAIFALSSGMAPAIHRPGEHLHQGRDVRYEPRTGWKLQIPFIEDFAELGERLDRPFGNYSSGMRARLSYAIAMATEPDLFIIDESLAQWGIRPSRPSVSTT